jgi:hypothetical protein
LFQEISPVPPSLPSRTQPCYPARGGAALWASWLPNGRRADILALSGDGGFVCIEVKSGARDFLTDAKWPDYRACSDMLYFAVDDAFPLDLLPDEVGLIVACDGMAEILREASPHPLPSARRRSLLLRFATLAALRLAAQEDPFGAADLRAALRVE